MCLIEEEAMSIMERWRGENNKLFEREAFIDSKWIYHEVE